MRKFVWKDCDNDFFLILEQDLHNYLTRNQEISDYSCESVHLLVARIE